MQIEPATKRLFTVDEYYRIAETGILGEDRRTELIGGEILQVSKMGPRHAAAISRCAALFGTLPAAKAAVRIQLPVRLDEFNVPEPDIAIVAPRSDFYFSDHPFPHDVLLLMEISDASLRYDRDLKGAIYASMGISEFWIASIELDAVLVFRDPTATGYQTSVAFHRGSRFSVQAFPELSFSVDEILGS